MIAKKLGAVAAGLIMVVGLAACGTSKSGAKKSPAAPAASGSVAASADASDPAKSATGSEEAKPGQSSATGKPADDNYKAAKEYNIALVSKGFQHQFWQAVRIGAEEEAKKLGVKVTFEGPAAETEIDAQLQMMMTAVDRKPDAIGFASLDPKACQPGVEAAKKAGIPVVEFDAGCDSDYPTNVSKTDSMVAGALAAKNMAKLVNNKGKIGIVAHSQINSTGVERRDGFVNEMKKNHPDITIVDIQYGDGDHLKSSEIAKAMIAANADLVGLYGTNEGSAIGIVNAAKELGLPPGKLIIVGFDSGQQQIDAIKSGLMAGAITQDPLGIGRSTVLSAVKAIEGKPVEKIIDTGSYWYDKNNVDSPEIAKLLYK